MWETLAKKSTAVIVSLYIVGFMAVIVLATDVLTGWLPVVAADILAVLIILWAGVYFLLALVAFAASAFVQVLEFMSDKKDKRVSRDEQDNDNNSNKD